MRIILLVLPVIAIIQQFIPFANMSPLKGAYSNVNFPRLTWENWSNKYGGLYYQNKVENYLIQNFGFEEWTVRFHNQIVYSIFGDSPNNGIVLEKDEYIIGPEYLNSFLGKDFIGDDLIKFRCEKLKNIENYLEAKEKQLIVVIAPDKASFYQEHYGLPQEGAIDSSNYIRYVQYLNEYNISYIDFRKAFIEAKDTSKYPLFPRTGIHWSIYGMNLAIDSVYRFLEVEMIRPMPKMNVSKVEVKNNIQRKIEFDAEESLNLFTQLERFPMGYQKYSIEVPDEGKPKVLVISDSFFFESYVSGLASRYSQDPIFWYYNNEAFHWKRKQLDTKVSKVNMDSVINEMDVVWLMSTSLNLDKFPWEFDENFETQVMNKDSL